MSASMTRTKTPEGGHSGPPKSGLEKPAAVGATILSDVADLIMGQSPPSSTYNDGGKGLPFFQGKTDFGFRHPVARLFCNAPLKIAQPDDILMSVRAPVGPTNIADRECCIGRGLAAIRPRDIDGDFLFFNLRYIEKFIASLGSGSTFHAINKSQLAAVEVNPHKFGLPDQRKIAAVLGVVQQAIEQQERLIALTTELKKTLLHQLFTQGLRGEPQKQTEIGPMPESWEVVKIGSLGKVVTGTTPKTKVPEYYAPPEVDFIAPADLGRTRLIYDSEKKISIAGLETIRRLPKDAVMCVCIGSSIGKVGMTAKEHSATNQQINSIVCGEWHEAVFVYYLLSCHRDYWRGFATFGPVPILSKGSFEAIKIAVPPTKEEEIDISRSLCALDTKAEVHMRKHAALTALFRTLLHQLMTAQVRVHNLDLPELETATQG